MAKKSISSNQTQWFLFLIFPFFAVINAFKHYKSSWAKNIFWAFVVFFGFTFGTSKEKSLDGGSADIFRYEDQVKELHKLDLSFQDIKKLYADNDDVDILRLTIAIVISRFTDSMQLLTAVYGFIFGFFFSRNLWFVFSRIRGKIKPIVLVLLAALFLVNPMWNINGFRFHTANHIFIYGLLPFLFEGKKKGIFISALSILVHFSFLLPVLILLGYVLIGNRTIFFFGFFLISIVTSEINISRVNDFIDAHAPQSFAKKSSGYRDEEKVEEFREDDAPEDEAGNDIQVSWHARVYLKALYWSLMAFLIFIFFIRKKLVEINPRYLNSLSFTFLFWGVANFLSTLPSGARFLNVASLSALPLIIFYIQNQPVERKLKRLVQFAIPALFLFIVVAMRVGFYTLSVNTFIGNPIVAVFTDFNLTLNDLIK